MSTILLLTVDDHLALAVRNVCDQQGWDLTVLANLPSEDTKTEFYDLVLLDCRPAPESHLSFSDIASMTLHLTGPVRAGRALAIAHYEDLMGRMNELVQGGSAYVRIHAVKDPPIPNLELRLTDAIQDALSLPQYEPIDFHDGFPDREFYRQLFESAQVPIVVLTSTGTIKLMNLRALAHFDYETQMVINQDWSMLIAPSDRGKRAQDFLTRISSGYFYEGTLRGMRRRGEEFPALVTSSRVFAGQKEQGDLLIVLAIHDLTQLEELQRQVAVFQKMESVERLVAGMTHEFNNMLTAILGHAELLTEDLPSGSDLQDSARVIQKEAQRAQELTGRLLGLSSSRQFMPGPVSCNHVVLETIELLKPSFGSRIHFETDLLSSGDMVEGEASQLRQVLVNLCLNARDATSGEGVISFRTLLREVLPEECRLHGDWTPGFFVEIAVRDEGHGMTPHELDRVFEPFYTTKPDGSGTGLGLSVVRGIVSTHGGHVAIESSPSQGSTVMVRLPPMELPAEDTITSPEIRGIAGTSGGGAGILVVDDDRAVLMFAQKVLERAGYHVRLATYGALAIDEYAQHSKEIGLIVLDLAMPGTDGRDVVRAIRQRDTSVPIILCTGFAPGGVDDELVNQVQGFLKKPYRQQELLEQVAEVLASARQSE